MARPKIIPEQKRIYRYVIRLNEKEQQKFLAAAEVSGVEVYKLLRAKLLTVPEAKIARDLYLNLELKKIGVSVNQIAKQFNAGKLPFQINKILLQLKELQYLIIKVLPMIAIQKIGKSFMGAFSYNLKKMAYLENHLRAEILVTNFTSLDPLQVRKEVVLLRSLKPNLNRHVYHTSLNFSKEEVLDNKIFVTSQRLFKGAGLYQKPIYDLSPPRLRSSPYTPIS